MTIRIVYISTCRSDFGAATWLLRDLAADARFDFELWAGGAHLDAGTDAEILAEGFSIAARLPFDVHDHARGAGQAIAEASSLLSARRPDLVLLYGDRHELLPLAHAAVLAGIPIGHLCGGDVTEGALDEQVRHAMTKLAHLHFASSARSAQRIRQMGEEAWRVYDVGDPSLDQFTRGERAGADELAALLGFVPDARTLLVTWHPATVDRASSSADTRALVDALGRHDGPLVITAPAPDPGADEIRAAMSALVKSRPRSLFVESLGSRRYRGLMALAGAMVGNSSSGLSEAPCVPLPVVNVGDRQAGRDRAANVIDVPAQASAIADAIGRALEPGFRASLAGLRSPYGDGKTSRRIVEILAGLPERERLLRKKFREPARAADRRPSIGGDFAIDSSSLIAAGSGFTAGRDALAAIVVAQPRRGRWLVPEFLCPVVAATLRACGAEPIAYPLATPWLPELSRLAPLLEGAQGVVVPFHLGLPPDEALWPIFDGRELIVVEDCCQCPGPPPPSPSLRGHHAIGSLRKWAPVPDGAWLISAHGSLSPSGPPAATMTRLRLAAGLAKSANADPSGDGAVEEAYVALFRAGEAAAGVPAIPRRASAIGASLYGELDVAALIARRLHNQRTLARAVAAGGRVQLWEPSPGAIERSDVPLLALPLLVGDRDRLRARLAEERVFAPVHWRDGDWSGAGGRAFEWASHTLSIPIDARVDDRMLARLVELLT